MNNIDNRIVNMIFNNRDFEDGVSETTESLDKLKKSLDFSHHNIDLSGITNGLEALQNRFSVVGEQVHQFVTNIVNQAKRLVDEAMIAPIRDGFNEYELKMGSIQTILNSAFNRSGAPVTLEEVNAQLNELNKYADRTIYSFKDMTSNIGKFTNAGVALEDAVAAIQGVSNVAAVSGANAADASRAMYNFAQALSSGYVKLIDWKSIENANMATVEFKNQLLESAVAAGTLEKTADGMYKVLSGGGFKENGVETYISATNHFNDSLSKAWMTTEVLTSTLSKYSDETTEIGKKAFAAATEVKTLSQAWDTLKESAGSSWAETWETIFGDLNQSKTLWSRLEADLEEIFVKGGEKRNELLKTWSDLGGRYMLFSTDEDNLGALFNLLEAVKQIISVVKQAFTDVFGEANVMSLVKLTAKFQNFTKSLIMSEETFENVRWALRGVFSVFGIFKDILSAVGKAFTRFFDGFKTDYSSYSFFKLIAQVGVAITNLRNTLSYNGVFESITKTLGKFFEELGYLFGGVASAFHSFISIFTDASTQFGLLVTNTVKPIDFIKTVLKGLYDLLGEIAADIIYFFAGLFGKDQIAVYDAVVSFFDNFALKVSNLSETIRNSKIVTQMKEFWATIKGATEGGGGKIKDMLTSIKDFFVEIADKIHPLKTLSTVFTTLFDLIKNVAKAIAPLAGSLGAFSINLLKGLADVVTNLFEMLGRGVKDGTLGALLTGGLNIGLGVGLFKSFKSFQDMLGSITGVFGEDGAIAGMFNSLGNMLQSFEKKAGAETLKTTAISIAILAASLILLASVDSTKLAGATLVIGGLMQELLVATRSLTGMKLSKSIASASTSLIKMGAAILVLAVALKVISSVEPKKLTDSILALTVILGEMVATVKILGSGKHLNSLKKVGQGLIGLSAAILVLALAVKAFGSMEANQLGQGLKTVSLLLVELTAFSKIAGNSKHMLSIGTGLLLISNALLVFVGAIKVLGKMDGESLTIGLIGITFILGEMAALAGAFNLLNPAKVAVASASMILLATSMLEVTAVLKILATMNFEQLVVSMAAFGLALVGMAATLAVLQALNPVKMLGASAAMVILGAALIEMSVALKIIGSMSLDELVIALLGITSALVVMGVAAVALGPMAGTMLAIAGAFTLFGIGVAAFGAGLVLISTGLAALAGSLAVSATAILSVAKTLITALPELLAALAVSLGQSLSSIIDILATLIVSILEAIRKTIPEIVDVVLEVISKVLASVAEHIEEIVVSLLDIVVGVIDGMAKGIPEIISSVVELFKNIFAALKNAIGDLSAETILEAIGITAALTVLMVEIAALTALGVAATAMLPVIGENLSSFIDKIGPFLDGIKSVGTETLDGAKALADAILTLTVSSILDGITRWITGKSSFESFGKELANFGPYLKTYNDSIKGINAENISVSADAIQTMVNMANTLPNSGGVVSWFTGDNTLSDFGKMLSEFGPYFKKYADSVNGINTYSVAASATAASTLAEMAAGLPNSGGIVSWFTGDNTLADFGAMLANFGPYLKSYGDKVNGLNTTAIASSVGATNDIVKVATAVDGLKLTSDSGTVSNFGSQIQKLGGFIYSYNAYITAVNWDTFARSVTEINTIADLADRLSLIDSGKLSTFGKDMQTMANNGIKLLISAFTSSFTRVKSKAQEVARHAVTGLNTLNGQFTIAGINMMQGLINGLNSRAQSVYNTATAIANTAAAIVRRALQIRSPSRVFEEIGMYVDLGFAQGLTKYANTIESSADVVGRSAMDSMAEAIQTAVDNIDDNPEFTPTITPVLDLSDVNAGLGGLGNGFNVPVNTSGFYRQTSDLASMAMQASQNNQNGGEMREIMNNMMNEISSLAYAVENMQIVMDSGVVVGAIAPKMDVALGQRIVHRGRGN